MVKYHVKRPKRVLKFCYKWKVLCIEAKELGEDHDAWYYFNERGGSLSSITKVHLEKSSDQCFREGSEMQQTEDIINIYSKSIRKAKTITGE